MIRRRIRSAGQGVLPPIAALQRQGALAVARSIAEGERSCEEVVEASIARCRELHPLLNALVADRFVPALSEARAMDRHVAECRARGDRPPPLAGVPFVVAECVACEGMSHSAGSLLRGEKVADADATAIARLRSAGAILLGVANVVEMGMGLDTHNMRWGRTPSPFAPERVAGGAAGGVAALVSLGVAAFGIAPDTLGDARLAAQFCGVSAHKPTGGLVPGTGLFPPPRGRARRYVSLSVLSASVSDHMPLLRLMAGPDGVDRAVVNRRLRDSEAHDFTWKRAVLAHDFGLPGLTGSRAQRRMLGSAAEALRARGAEVEEWRPRELADAAEIWLAMMHEAQGIEESFGADLLGTPAASVARELLRSALGRSRHTRSALAYAALEKLTKGHYVLIQRNCARGRRLRERLNALLGDGGVMLAPLFPQRQPRGGSALLRPRAFLHTALFNVLELPSVAVVPGLGDDGLPMGLQVIAAQGRDDAALAAAAVVTHAMGTIGPPSLRALRSFRH